MVSHCFSKRIKAFCRLRSVMCFVLDDYSTKNYMLVIFTFTAKYKKKNVVQIRVAG